MLESSPLTTGSCERIFSKMSVGSDGKLDVDIFAMVMEERRGNQLLTIGELEV